MKDPAYEAIISELRIRIEMLQNDKTHLNRTIGDLNWQAEQKRLIDGPYIKLLKELLDNEEYWNMRADLGDEKNLRYSVIIRRLEDW